MLRWAGVSRVLCWTWPAEPPSVTKVDALEFVAQVAPGVAGLAFAEAHEQQREPADQDVGADALLEAVEDRAQGKDAMEVAEGALGFEQVLVAERDVLGADVGG